MTQLVLCIALPTVMNLSLQQWNEIHIPMVVLTSLKEAESKTTQEPNLASSKMWTNTGLLWDSHKMMVVGMIGKFILLY